MPMRGLVRESVAELIDRDLGGIANAIVLANEQVMAAASFFGYSVLLLRRIVGKKGPAPRSPSPLARLKLGRRLGPVPMSRLSCTHISALQYYGGAIGDRRISDLETVLASD
jgi:hypothetical protein